MKVCPNCGKVVEKNFCPVCGVEAVETEAAEAAETVEAVVETVPMVVQPVVEAPVEEGEPCLTTKATAVFAYLGLAGFLIAILIGDKKGAAFHINQALVLNVASYLIALFFIIPILGWIAGAIAGIFLAVCWVIGLVNAFKLKESPVPFFGKYKLFR